MQHPCATPADATFGQQAIPTYSLLSRREDHLKLNGRTPLTFAEKLQARADYTHTARTAEIKKIAGKLALLEPLLPALAALGTPVHNREIYPWTSSDVSGVALSIHSNVFEGGNDDKLFDALLSQGFREVERCSHYRSTEHVILKYGRALLVRIQVTAKPAAQLPVAREEVAA